MLKSQIIDEIMLDIYDEQLADMMEKIMNYRKEFIEKISVIASKTHFTISSQKEELVIEYNPNIKTDSKEKILDILKKSRQDDIQHRTSSKGIQKDDIMLAIGDIDIRKFGSQGQKKTATIALKLSEIDHNDTDRDGLTDAQELGESVEESMDEYINLLLEKHSVPKELYTGKRSITIWKYNSNPTELDTDFDGLPDGNIPYSELLENDK